MKGFVYFLRCGDFVKIGFSAKPSVRLNTLRTGNPYEVTVAAIHAGTRGDEQALHRQFSHLHHRGEWFRSGLDLEAVISGGLPDNHLIQPDLHPLVVKAIAIFGSETKLAAAIQVRQSQVWRMKHKLARITCEMAQRIHWVTGEAVPAWELRPDAWSKGERPGSWPYKEAA